LALGEATPLRLPLDGGREGATVVVHPLVCAQMSSPPEWMAMRRGRLATVLSALGSRRDWIDVPIPAFLVEHPGAGRFLVDTGFHPSVAIDPKQNLGPVFGRLYDIDMRPEQAIPAQLRALGIDPHEIRLVVMTHLHLDHASAISEFTNAVFVLGQGEWQAVQGPRPTLHGYVRRQMAHAVDYREVVYDDRSVDSYSTFARSVDLFGDGSVRLVHTPGHSMGHQSLVLRLADREALVAGDAIYFLRTLDNERRGLAMADEHLWRRSLREIQLYRREHPDALIIPGHDHEAWQGLDKSYA
jgi:N-acyl homoserine lactone hydrolase